MGLFSALKNFDNNKSLKKLEKIANKVELLADKYSQMEDEELQAQTAALKARFAEGETLDELLPDAYAVVREAAGRVLGMRHFHVQILGGIALHQGRIAEMCTGEGKTLVSTLPAYLNAISGKPVHVVTVNEYLAKRDAEWMGKVHRFLGLSVGFIYTNQPQDEKKKAYECDITYGTNSEFGFDYLRDNMCTSKNEMVQRGLDFAVVDEVDSILIDEARTPLIISGPSGESSEQYTTAAKFAKTLKTDDVDIDEKQKTIHLTESGVERAERYYRLENLSDIENTEINHNINNAIRAQFLMHRDEDYIVRDNEVLIVDEFTGRIMVGRRYSNGLHQAIEAKEGVKIQGENKTYATITFQNFFKIYKKLSGMTGTAKTEEGEFREIYYLDVVTIPTNLKSQRIDENDIFFFSNEAKLNAICEDIKQNHANNRPVLVGTLSVAKSEELSKKLTRLGIKHNVLNAKNHLREAEIIAQAGKLGAVTIATNMAGRGTDILLGGNSEFMAKQELKKAGFEEYDIDIAASFFPTENEEQEKARRMYLELKDKFDTEVKKEKKEVILLGGLRIIGTERHESRRIDNQLRGRAGRQGDPGSSIFYVSADDDLSRVFGSERLKRMAEFFKLESDASINWKFFSRSVENAQKRVEGNNYSIRKSVVEYDNVLNHQREEVYKERNKIIAGEDMHEKIVGMIRDVVDDIVEDYSHFTKPEEVDIEAYNRDLEKRLLEPETNFITLEIITDYTSGEIADEIYKRAVDRYEFRKAEYEKQGINFGAVERDVLLKILDRKWIDHIDDMDNLRTGIGLRGYGNKNPITVYQTEGFEMFDYMIGTVRKDVANFMMGVKIQIGISPEQLVRMRQAQRANLQASGGGEAPQPIKKQSKDVGRNDPCPCGSGKKYKNCCGK
ncbi:MAG: preprotein translocase subunit SecA [Clostridiales bacterium]|nr:preprotein translocase subunit SecA [Clostridiales bacterium]